MPVAGIGFTSAAPCHGQQGRVGHRREVGQLNRLPSWPAVQSVAAVVSTVPVGAADAGPAPSAVAVRIADATVAARLAHRRRARR
jgi:hypothetical protein